MFAVSGAARIAYDVLGDTRSAGGGVGGVGGVDGVDDVDDVGSASRDAGGIDVVLFHAGVTDRRSWGPLVDRLSRRHRCVTFDARQFGETTYEPDPGWSFAADAVAVMDAAGVERAVLVGCSMGGGTALEVAVAHPERVLGLALIGTAVRGAPYPPNTDRAKQLEEQAEAAEQAADLDELNRLEAWMWLDGPSAPEGRVGGEPRRLFLDMNGRALRSADPGPLGEVADVWPRLPEIDVPTLFLVGTLDMPDIVAVDEQAAARIPHARLVRLPGTAHLPQLEGHTLCLDEVESFVADIADAAGATVDARHLRTADADGRNS